MSSCWGDGRLPPSPAPPPAGPLPAVTKATDGLISCSATCDISLISTLRRLLLLRAQILVPDGGRRQSEGQAMAHSRSASLWDQPLRGPRPAPGALGVPSRDWSQDLAPLQGSPGRPAFRSLCRVGVPVREVGGYRAVMGHGCPPARSLRKQDFGNAKGAPRSVWGGLSA